MLQLTSGSDAHCVGAVGGGNQPYLASIVELYRLREHNCAKNGSKKARAHNGRELSHSPLAYYRFTFRAGDGQRPGLHLTPRFVRGVGRYLNRTTAANACASSGDVGPTFRPD